MKFFTALKIIVINGLQPPGKGDWRLKRADDISALKGFLCWKYYKMEKQK